MTMQRGQFEIVCDHDGCDARVDLETYEFEEAIENASERNNPELEGWRSHTKGYGKGFSHYCPDHIPEFLTRGDRR
jgi:hypothetical protein